MNWLDPFQTSCAERKQVSENNKFSLFPAKFGTSCSLFEMGLTKSEGPPSFLFFLFFFSVLGVKIA